MGGRAVLFPAPPGVGKTTLVTRLLLEGFNILSDDEILIQTRPLTFFPSERPILLKEDAPEFFPTLADCLIPIREDGRQYYWLYPDSVRGGSRAIAETLQAIVFLSREETGPILKPIGQNEAATHLLVECMNFPDLRDEAIRLIVELVQSADLFRLRRSTLNKAVAAIKEVLKWKPPREKTSTITTI